MLTRSRSTWLTLSVFAFICQTTLADDLPVSGLFKGNGKEAKLAHITALKGEPYLDKPTTVLVMTESDHSKEKKPDFMAAFGKFGCALIVTIREDGKVIGCEVVHSSFKKGTLSSVGTMKTSALKREDGMIQGKLSTNGESKAFGDTWEVNLTFKVKTP